MIVIASGYFDPLHAGHVEYLVKAKQLGHELWVIVNNDEQAKLKKGYSALDEMSRFMIVSNLKPVDRVILSIDTDGSVCETLKEILKSVPLGECLFAKGGDRFAVEIPEAKTGITIVDGLGEKIDSSTRIRDVLRDATRK